VTAETSHSITAADGVPLAAWLARPATPPAGALILCHGLTTDAAEHGAFIDLRDRALAAGLAVARFDFRGHGRSGGSNELLSLAGQRADVDAVIALVDERLGAELPVIPVGLSFGGAAAVHAAFSRSPCAALVLWYAVIDYRWNYGPDSPVPFTAQMRAAADPARDPAWAAMPVLGTDYYITHTVLEEATDDRTPLTIGQLNVPVLAFHGSRDRFVDPGPLRAIAAAHRNVELRTARGAGHGFVLWRPWVIRRTVAWSLAATRSARRRRPAHVR
jgi:alpha-beta hydrolase superfamily lysophospholipase